MFVFTRQLAGRTLTITSASGISTDAACRTGPDLLFSSAPVSEEWDFQVLTLNPTPTSHSLTPSIYDFLVQVKAELNLKCLTEASREQIVFSFFPPKTQS